MNTPKKSQLANDSKEQGQTNNMPLQTDDLEDDGTPVLDEADLAENNLTVEEAEDIEWEDAGTASAQPVQDGEEDM